MCTKKELVEWLEANVPDDAVVVGFIYDECDGGFYPLSIEDISYNAVTNEVTIP